MKKNEINIIINERNTLLTKLNTLLHSTNLLPNYSKSQYLVLSEKILNQLEKGTDYENVKKFIEDELIVSYGFYPYEVNSSQLTEHIFDLLENS